MTNDKYRDARIRQRTEHWGRLYDMGYVGHAYGGTRADWVHDKLVKEGTLPEPTEQTEAAS